MPDVDRRITAYTLKSVLAISSFTTAVGWSRLPGSLENSPQIFGQTAATTLCLGCILSIIGIWWQKHRRRSTGLILEQMGLVAVFVGCLLYAVALATVPRITDAALALGMSAGLAAAAAGQYFSIRRYRLLATPKGTAGHRGR